MMCSWVCVALIAGFTPVEAFNFPIFWPTFPPLPPTKPPLTLTPRTRTREPITQGASYWDDIDLRSSTPGIIDGSGNCVCNPGLGSSLPPSIPPVSVESPPPIIIIAQPSGDVSSTVSPDLTSTFPPRGYPPIETSGSGSPEGSGEESGEILGIPGIRESSGEASGAPEASAESSGSPETSAESSGIPEASGESSGITGLPEGSSAPPVTEEISVQTNAGLQQTVTDAIQVLNNMSALTATTNVNNAVIYRGASNALSFIQFIASSISFDTETLNQLAPSLTVLRTSLAQYPAQCRRNTATTYDYNVLDDVFNFDTSFWLAPQNAVSRFRRIFETAAQFVQDYCN